MKSSNLAFTSLVCTTVLAGCYQSIGGTTTVPTPRGDSLPVNTVIHNREASWSFSLDTATHRYQATTRTLLQTSAETNHKPDTILVQSQFTIQRERLHVSTTSIGTIDHLSIASGQRLHETGDSVSFSPTTFSVNVSRNMVLVTLDSSLPCSGTVMTVLGGIRNQTVVLPRLITPVSVWSDTVSIEGCKTDDIQSTGEIIRTYKVLGENKIDGIPVLLLQRDEINQLTGIGHQGQHQVELDAEGLGSTVIQVEVLTGTVLTLNSTQRLSVKIKTSGRTHLFTQLVEERTIRIY